MSTQDNLTSTGLLPLCHRQSSGDELYALMAGIRLFELSLLDLFGQGLLAGTTHTCLGQEATAVGVVSCLDRERDIILSSHRCHGHFLAYCGQVEALYLEIMGKPSGVCAGKGGSQHLHFKNFYSNGIQGGIMPIAIGMAQAQKLRKSKAIVTVFLGDGTFGEGAVYEALNIASLWQLPLLVIVENNGYAQSTPTRLQLSGSFRGRLEGFNIPVQEIVTTDVRQVIQSSSPLIDKVRHDGSPQALVVGALRLGPHSKGDDHRSQQEMDAIRAKDPLTLMNGPVQDGIYRQMQELIDATRQKVLQENLMTNAVLPKTYLASLNESLHAMMEADQRVLLIGEDILDPYGGAFKVSKGLFNRFPSRVLTTPISESAIVGLGTGLAMRGFLPIVEIMFGDFITLAADQLINHAAKFRWMYDEKVQVPLVVRTPMGGYRGYGPTHSQSLEKHFLGVAGLWVVSPNVFTQPGEMLRQAVMQVQEPVLFVEHKYAYSQLLIDAPEGMVKEKLVDEKGLFPTTLLRHCSPNPASRGLLLCYGGMAKMCLEAISLLRDEEDIWMDLAVVSQLSPVPDGQLQILFERYRDALLVYAEEASSPAGWGCEMMAVMQTFAMAQGKCQLRQLRIGSQFSVIPSSKQLEAKTLLNSKEICSQVLACF